MPSKNPEEAAAELRRRAEQQVTEGLQATPLSEAEVRRTLHELQVHQIELQMQYVALQESEAQAREAVLHLAELNQSMEARIAQRTAELVAARDAAEAANRAKSAFLSHMSHELRTPLNGVMGMVELALMRATDPRQIDWLGKARSSAAHLLSVINDILDLSKMEAEQLPIERVEFRLGQLLEYLTQQLAPEVARKGLAFDVDVAAALAQRPLLGDAQRLGQILLHLGRNAVKFTAEGVVRIAARVDGESADGPTVRFEVEDSGIGIAPHDQERLFHAFAQVDDTISRLHGGTGLGLAICRRLVDLMGGQLGLASTPGVGTTFWFTVPLGSSGEHSAASPADAPPAGLETLKAEFPGARLLLAEDNPVNQEVVRGLFDGTGIQVDIAGDGAAAVDMALAGGYALILMDLQMPKLSGIDATRAIRHVPGHQRIPIIGLTASVFEQDRQRCVDAGMDDHLAKPLQPDLLYATLLKWLRQSSLN